MARLGKSRHRGSSRKPRHLWSSDIKRLQALLRDTKRGSCERRYAAMKAALDLHKEVERNRPYEETYTPNQIAAWHDAMRNWKRDYKVARTSFLDKCVRGEPKRRR